MIPHILITLYLFLYRYKVDPSRAGVIRDQDLYEGKK
ncbi:MAG: hypothetical protein SBU_000037 [Candidatus Syntrophoarchaeum butanivorans]|uniref:Uncharacterized protein n=1 Tax=Candidatus Syntropharchaeum butanivorans TaxID=1839936 RepID=A0A1F2P6E8_9EURY|nr:MAG: hypothetical protein SBU_000037 [Candidatus Syntrophoarchaeum butanivorans]